MHFYEKHWNKSTNDGIYANVLRIHIIYIESFVNNKNGQNYLWIWTLEGYVVELDKSGNNYLYIFDMII